MLNQIPGRLGCKLTTPLERVSGVKFKSKTWLEIFSISYFNKDLDGAVPRSKIEDHSLNGIAMGQDNKTNTIVFYNPLTLSCYGPPVFCLKTYRLLIINFP